MKRNSPPQSSKQTSKKPSKPQPKPVPRLLLLTVALVLISVLAIAVHMSRPKAGDQTTVQTQPPPPPPPTPPPPPVPQAQPAQHAHQHDQPPPVPPEERRRFVDSLRHSFVVEECCALPLNDCLRQKPQCAVAPMLNKFVNWLDSIAHANPSVTNELIADELQKRYVTLTDKRVHPFDVRGWPVVGDENAPITLGMYYAGTCPVCKTNFRDLYAAVTRGPLRGKVKIVAKPFTVGIVNKALVAAQDMGRFNDYMLEMARRGGRMDTVAVYDIAAALLFDANRFKQRVESPEVQKRLEESTREAEANNVKFVPSYYINGRSYESRVNPMWVIDALEFEYDAITKRRR